MKRVIMYFVVSFFLVSLMTANGFGQTADQILEKMIAAQGGRKALEAVKDATYTGTMEMPQMGISGSLTMYQKEPDKSRMDIEIMGMMVTQAYDGKTAWMVDPNTGAASEMPEKMAQETKRQAMGSAVLLNPKKLGITYTFKGKEKVKDTDCLVLEQAFADGHKTTLYIDAKTYLLYKSKSISLNEMGAEVEAESYETGYKKVEGIMVAHDITIFHGGQEFLKLKITEVSYNTDLEDAFFKMED